MSILNLPWRVESGDAQTKSLKGKKSYFIVDCNGNLIFNTEWGSPEFPNELVEKVNNEIIN